MSIEITAGHARVLKRLGLSEDWYTETYSRLEGRCERCGKPETKLKYGTPAPLTVDTTTKPPRLLCQKCAARKNKVNQRKRDAARQEKEDNKTAQVYWNEQRRKLTESQRAEYEALEADVQEQFEWAKEHMEFDWNKVDETDEDRANTQEARNDFEAFVKERGEVFNLTLTQFWRVDDGAHLKQLLRDSNEVTRVFLQYGCYIGMPWTFTSRWREWRTRVEWKPPTNPIVKKSEWVMMVCVNAKRADSPCGDMGKAMRQSTADLYAAKHIPYLCYKCLAVERSSRAEIAAHPAVTRESAIDAWGRVRDE